MSDLDPGTGSLRAGQLCLSWQWSTSRRTTSVSLFMIVERFRNGEAGPVYRRFKERGRMAPDGLTYVSSWVAENLTTCYQVMETSDRALLDEWMRNWKDLVEFEVHPVITSQEAAQRVAMQET